MILQSSWCFEVHSNGWLSDLKVGKATKILKGKKVLIQNMVVHRFSEVVVMFLKKLA